MFADSETHADFLEMPFLARLTSVQSGSGAQASLNLYGFIEQSFDALTGIPADAVPARQDNLADAANCYALESSNTLLTVPGSTLPGYTNPGPYVTLRLRGIVNGAPVYEFQAPATSTFSGAQYTYASTASVPNITWTALPVTGMTQVYDTDSYTPSMVVPATGYYRGIIQAVFALSGGSSPYWIALARTSSSVGFRTTMHISNTTDVNIGMGNIELQISWEQHYLAGDTVASAWVYQDSGAAMTILQSLRSIEKMG